MPQPQQITLANYVRKIRACFECFRAFIGIVAPIMRCFRWFVNFWHLPSFLQVLMLPVPFLLLSCRPRGHSHPCPPRLAKPFISCLPEFRSSCLSRFCFVFSRIADFERLQPSFGSLMPFAQASRFLVLVERDIRRVYDILGDYPTPSSED